MGGEEGWGLSGVAKGVLRLALSAAGAMLGTVTGCIALVFALHLQDFVSTTAHESIQSRISHPGSALWLAGFSSLGAAFAGTVIGLLSGRRPRSRCFAAIASGVVVGCIASVLIWSNPAVTRAMRGDIILPPPVFFAGFALAGLASGLVIVTREVW